MNTTPAVRRLETGWVMYYRAYEAQLLSPKGIQLQVASRRVCGSHGYTKRFGMGQRGLHVWKRLPSGRETLRKIPS